MKLKIDNQTNYETKDLKALFHKCMEQEGVDTAFIKVIKFTPRRRSSGYVKRLIEKGELDCAKRMSSQIVNNQSNIHGYAFYNSHSIVMRLPEWRYGCSSEGLLIKEPIQEFNQEEVKTIARVFTHEVGHNQCLHHKDMADWWNFDAEYVKDFKVRLKQKTEKPIQDLKQKQYENVLEHIKQKESQIKRLTNQLKKWELKQKYYETRLEAK